jgi:hypothetical protein
VKTLFVAVSLLAAVPALAQTDNSAPVPPGSSRSQEVGPFGFRQGMTLAELQKVSTLASGSSPHMYKMRKAPKPHSAFEGYIVIVSPKYGLCKAIGIGKDISVNSFGEELASEYEKVERALKAKYGEESMKLDSLRPGSIWHEPNEWMMALKLHERVLTTIWTIEKGATLPPDVDSIGLDANANSRSEGYISLAVEFKNFDRCKAEYEQKRDDAL